MTKDATLKTLRKMGFEASLHGVKTDVVYNFNLERKRRNSMLCMLMKEISELREEKDKELRSLKWEMRKMTRRIELLESKQKNEQAM